MSAGFGPGQEAEGLAGALKQQLREGGAAAAAAAAAAGLRFQQPPPPPLPEGEFAVSAHSHRVLTALHELCNSWAARSTVRQGAPAGGVCAHLYVFGSYLLVRPPARRPACRL